MARTGEDWAMIWSTGRSTGRAQAGWTAPREGCGDAATGPTATSRAAGTAAAMTFRIMSEMLPTTAGQDSSPHIRSGASIPSSPSPSRRVDAVSSQSSSRLARVASSGALSTEHDS